MVFPHEETVRLPHRKEVVKVPCHRAIDCLERLLTDPRITDDDYCFFDDDPRAPPPDDLDYIGDINTGSAYVDTYKKLVDTPGKEQLMGVIFYIDGASCGHFANLPVTAVKMSLTCFTRKARLKEHPWVPHGYIPHINHCKLISPPQVCHVLPLWWSMPNLKTSKQPQSAALGVVGGAQCDCGDLCPAGAWQCGH